MIYFLGKILFQWTSAQIRTFQFRKIKPKNAIKKFRNNSEHILTLEKHIKMSISLFCDNLKNFLQDRYETITWKEEIS